MFDVEWGNFAVFDYPIEIDIGVFGFDIVNYTQTGQSSDQEMQENGLSHFDPVNVNTIITYSTT